MDKEDIEEAIEVLEDASAEMLTETGNENYYGEAIAILRQALVDADDTSQERVDETSKAEHEWVGLTDAEVSEIIDQEIGFNSCWGPEETFARAVEEKLKEKNHG
jgi:hypothetical protein